MPADTVGNIQLPPFFDIQREHFTLTLVADGYNSQQARFKPFLERKAAYPLKL